MLNNFIVIHIFTFSFTYATILEVKEILQLICYKLFILQMDISGPMMKYFWTSPYSGPSKVYNEEPRWANSQANTGPVL